jgi:hypothetical protein
MMTPFSYHEPASPTAQAAQSSQQRLSRAKATISAGAATLDIGYAHAAGAAFMAAILGLPTP